jgi:hypothetical protein
MGAIIKYDHLLFVENKHMLASNIISIDTNQAGNIVLSFDADHIIVITDEVEKENFKAQYKEFLNKNGIRMWGEL